jgi:hypothetical protein
MKSKFFFLIAFTSFLLGCEKEEFVPIFHPGSMTYGRMNADKNGVDWVASSLAQVYDTIPSLFGIGASTFSEEGFARENLAFNKIPKQVGRYNIRGPINNILDGFTGSSYFTKEDDGDALEDTYEVDESVTDNYLEVTLLDTVAHHFVQGKFTVSFKIATPGGKRNPSNPDKVKFSNGTFDVKFFR